MTAALILDRAPSPCPHRVGSLLSVLVDDAERKIITDWMGEMAGVASWIATFDDCAPGAPICGGATEQDAIDDLLETADLADSY